MNRQTTILVVEDDAKTAASLRLYLEHGGFRVLVAHSGRDGLILARQESPNLLLLDLMLPELDGITLCRTLRAEADIPVVMLTARTTEDDKLRGLETGADDYVTKPFSPREVVARVKAVLRRTRGPDSSGPEVLRWSEIVMERVLHRVTVRGKSIPLTPVEFRLLEIFLRSPGRVFSRQELLEKLSGKSADVFDRTVDAHVKNLRAKIDRGRAKLSWIATVHGVGYKLAEEGNA